MTLFTFLRRIIRKSRKASKARERKRLNSPEGKGRSGEDNLYNQLKRINCYKLFVPNLYINYNENQYTEIDLIMLTEYGIFVYEMKNYSGNIYGNAASKQWKQYLNDEQFSFYNPILQNKGHIYALHNATKLNNSVFYSMIVFGQNTRAKIYNVDNKECKITNLQSVAQLTKTLITNRTPIFTQIQVEGIYNLLIRIKNENDVKLGKK